MIRVNEIFGPTVQGEGSAAGRHCLFVRLYDCNLHCGFCDTPYTWANTAQRSYHMDNPQVFPKEENMREMEAEDIIDELRELWDIDNRPTIIVISGGEPVMQSRALATLAMLLRRKGHEIHIETAGTIVPDYTLVDQVTQFNVSPKLDFSGNPAKKRYKPEVLRWFIGDENPVETWFKYVVRNEDDLYETISQVEHIGIDPGRVMVMPEGVDAKTNIKHVRGVAEAAIRYGFGVSMRTHILLWDDTRGK